MESETSHLVRDEMTGDWVIIAPGRRKRPDGFKGKRPFDPFSPKNIPKEDVIARYGKGADAMMVVRNKFPVFGSSGLGGTQEIIVEGSRVMPFWDSRVERIAALLDAFSERFRVLRRDKGLKYLQAFKNEGSWAGASQPHPHSQIFALPFVPERLRDEARRRRMAVKRLGMSGHAYALSLAKPTLSVFRDRNVVAFANPAGRFAYEVRIVPRRRVDNISKTTPVERRSLAKAITSLLPLMKEHKASYNLFFHDVIDERDEHFEIRFAPRLNTWGGFELDAGAVVNPVPASRAAAEYRAADR
jgi:UDPglucose--hexose-1-phosphate uridylyltransferase